MRNLYQFKFLILLVAGMGLLSGCGTVTTYSLAEVKAAFKSYIGTDLVQFEYYTQDNLVKLLGAPQTIKQKNNQQILQYPGYSFTLQNDQLTSLNIDNRNFNSNSKLYSQPCQDPYSVSITFLRSSIYHDEPHCWRSPFLDTTTIGKTFDTLRSRRNTFTTIAKINYLQYNPLIISQKAVDKMLENSINDNYNSRISDVQISDEFMTIRQNRCIVISQTGNDYRTKDRGHATHLVLDTVYIYCPVTHSKKGATNKNEAILFSYSNRYSPGIKNEIDTKLEAIKALETFEISNIPQQ